MYAVKILSYVELLLQISDRRVSFALWHVLWEFIERRKIYMNDELTYL